MELSASKWLGKILNTIKIIVVCFLCAALVINLYLIVAQLADRNDLPKIFGFAQIIIISGSMQPEIKAGDLIIIKEQAAYKEDDIVTYRKAQILITHRVVEANASGVITKGDANNTNDDPVALSDIEGKVVLCIPGAGKFVLFLRTPTGMMAIIGLIFLLYIINSVAQKLKREKSR